MFSRHGYGWSAPVTEPRAVTYMHDEADHVLPALLGELAIQEPVLIGHSDGASIALLYAGAGHAVRGLVLLAPHVFVEDCTIEAIAAAREAYATTDLPAKMARHHRDADATFRGWNDIWLAPEFRSWNIEERLAAITVPVLVVQGTADPYGTLAQVDAIEHGVRGPVERLVLPGIGHAPHLEAPAATVEAVAAFVNRLGAARVQAD